MAKGGFLAAILVCSIVADAFSFGELQNASWFGEICNSSPPQQTCSLFFWECEPSFSIASLLPDPVSGFQKSDSRTDNNSTYREVTTTSTNLTPKGQNGGVSMSSSSVEQNEKKKNDEKKEHKELHEPAGMSGDFYFLSFHFIPSHLNWRCCIKCWERDCVHHMGPLGSDTSVFLSLPLFDKLITSINGAYLLILTVVIFGVVWPCCVFRKQRRKSEFRYQARNGSGEGTDNETEEGWDQGWDNDWDEEDAVKSPGQPHVGNISANGLSSRPANRDGWQCDWDD
ncbi:hypothetical protein ACJRO7_000756 [Eucalyptus globulus]|uniref:Uncharacterized protein n=1 Tax=Eucalyptus globulus TaxID=34317 RepID=A0ABD3LNP7_EUCGL